jgi:hypothetical protein
MLRAFGDLGLECRNARIALRQQLLALVQHRIEHLPATLECLQLLAVALAAPLVLEYVRLGAGDTRLAERMREPER